MKRWNVKPSLTLILFAVMIGLLPTLAVLQYRWVGQVSRSERERMETSLRSGVTRFSRDFDREIARAFLTFQIKATASGERTAADYRARFERWLATAPYPQIIDEVFKVEADEAGASHLARFNRDAGRLEPLDWPARMHAVRERVEQKARQAVSQPRLILKDSIKQHTEQRVKVETRGGMVIEDDPIAEDAPALLIPFSGDDINAPRQRPDLVRAGYTIVTINIDYLKDVFIPALASNHFSSGDGLDYIVAIISRDDEANIIYQSEPDTLEAAASSPDLRASLFSVRLSDLEDLFRENNFRSKGPGVKISSEKEGTDVDVLDHRIGVAATRTMMEGRGDGHWQLAVKHRAGSLEAAVAVARRRNLIISFGILLLMAASLAMIIASTRKAERLARQQMEFVAGVSHELRTPLAVICSAGENLADGLIDERGQVRRYGSLIESEGRRLAQMVEQVLEFSGIQSGRKAYSLRSTNARDIIEDAIIASQPLIIEGGYEIEKSVEANLPPVLADRMALSRAVQNLLSNAMKYGGESRWIKITASVSPREPEVRITIEDKGPGIAPADLAHLFEPFYRGRASIEAQIHGSGLGLSLVKRMLEAHGGRVSVKSAQGRGSRFTLHLPAASAPVEASVTEVRY